MGPFALLLVAALALPQSAPEPEGLRIYSPVQFGVTAETPSRMPGSREEMNRGRNTALAAPVLEQAADASARAGLVCAGAAAAVIGRATGMRTVPTSTAPSLQTPLTMFIAGEPMKPATKTLTGWSYRSSGVPVCSTMPSRITTMRSAIVIASIWSCVT